MKDKLTFFLLKRLPPLEKNVPVFAVIVVLIYSWTIRWSFWKLPSWLYYLTAGEIASMFEYAFAANLFESVIALVGLNVLTILLPKTWLRDSFVVSGTILSSAGLSYLMYFASRFGREQDVPVHLLGWFPLFLLAILLLSFLIRKVESLVMIIEKFVDLLVVFLYLFIPLGVISTLLVLIRILV
jgi:hypothetical protein